ncbi:hypothetical protein WMY93_018721 [Mugilogobius chulae]|uniref:Guanine nucleotide-binding protein subunit gamma n=1 Tax=Mugilogobius chulae TaxID=88201 RepID=A0AAW0NV03_9GOBI
MALLSALVPGRLGPKHTSAPLLTLLFLCPLCPISLLCTTNPTTCPRQRQQSQCNATGKQTSDRNQDRNTQVSKAAADLMAYCDAHIREDPLIVPVPASENPFREKKFFCSIL